MHRNEDMKYETQSLGLYKRLFVSTFLISAFTVGGGYVIVPLLKKKFVDEYGWLNDEETLDLVAIAQAAPGVIAVNAAVILGYRIGGITGLLCAVLATILPPLITLTLVAYFYSMAIGNAYIKMALTGMQCAATAAIISVAVDLLRREIRRKAILPLILLITTFAAHNFWDINIMYLVILNACVGLLFLQQ